MRLWRKLLLVIHQCHISSTSCRSPLILAFLGNSGGSSSQKVKQSTILLIDTFDKVHRPVDGVKASIAIIAGKYDANRPRRSIDAILLRNPKFGHNRDNLHNQNKPTLIGRIFPEYSQTPLETNPYEHAQTDYPGLHSGRRSSFPGRIEQPSAK